MNDDEIIGHDIPDEGLPDPIEDEEEDDPLDLDLDGKKKKGIVDPDKELDNPDVESLDELEEDELEADPETESFDDRNDY